MIGFVILVVAVLIVFLKVTMAQHLSKATAHLNELNEDYTQKLDEARKRTQEADQHYDQMVLKANTDAENEKVRILKDVHEAEALILAEARKESTQIIEKAQKSRDAFLEELDQRVAEGAALKACELVQKILPDLITKEMHEAWVETLSKHGLEALERLNVSREVNEAQITSAYALTQAQKSALEKKISSKLGRDISFKEDVDPGLIAGVKIRLGGVVIDGSLKFKIKEAARHA